MASGRPTFLGTIIIGVDKGDNVENRVSADGKRQEVFVGPQPANRVRWERPPGFKVLDGDQPPVAHAAAVLGVVGAKLGADNGMDPVTSNNQIRRRGRAIGETELYEVPLVLS